MKTGRTRALLIVGALALALAVALVVRASCSPAEEQQRAAEDCSNGLDDDGDSVADCDDLDCLGSPLCGRARFGDRDARVPFPEIPERPQNQADDGGAAEDADEAQPYCTAESGICVWECEEDSDCVIAIDTMACCGGHPHEGDEGGMVTCPTAVHRARLGEDPCVFPLLRGIATPRPPRRCRPICDGLVCGPCRPPGRALCRNSECVGIPAGACARDEDCPEGETCVRTFEAGSGECRSGSHECTTDAECTTANPDCDSCTCVDADIDGFRDCACLNCPDGRCTVDGQCDRHEFCIDRQCQFAGDDACRMTLWDCEGGATCEPSEVNPARGRCLRPRPPTKR